MVGQDGGTRAAQMRMLRLWLLAEHGYEQGTVSDGELNAVQDEASDVLGPQAMPVLHVYLDQHQFAVADLVELAQGGPPLDALLQIIQDSRRPGFERRFQAPGAGPALLVMAEYSVDDPVWERPVGNGEPVQLASLGVSDPLVQGLRAWNERYERLALTDFEWPSPAVEAAWIEDGLRLAHELQKELPAVDVRYWHADDDRPLRQVTGVDQREG